MGKKVVKRVRGMEGHHSKSGHHRVSRIIIEKHMGGGLLIRDIHMEEISEKTIGVRKQGGLFYGHSDKN